MKFTNAIALILLALGLRAQELPKVSIQGFVYIDKNNNGLHESNEQGIPGVQVSDQEEIVSTDKNGFYRFESENARGYVFAIQPNGYLMKEAFWHTLSKDQQEGNYNFPLVPAPKSNSFTFVHASDTHLSEQSLPRLEKLRTMVDSLKPAFMIVTGDGM